MSDEVKVDVAACEEWMRSLAPPRCICILPPLEGESAEILNRIRAKVATDRIQNAPDNGTFFRGGRL